MFSKHLKAIAENFDFKKVLFPFESHAFGVLPFTMVRI